MTTVANVLTHQDEVISILDKEINVLTQKKNEIDGVIYGQKRSMDLYESNRKKQEHYIKITLYFIAFFVSMIVIRYLRKQLLIVPGFVFDLLVIAAIVIPGFAIYFALLDARRRDNMDFTKVGVPPPKGERDQAGQVTGAGSMFDLGKLCVGEYCCSDNTMWHGPHGKCITRSDAEQLGIDFMSKKEKEDAEAAEKEASA